MKKTLLTSLCLASILYATELDDLTQTYKNNWYDRAKDAWNLENTDNKYEFDYYTYHFPQDADLNAGNPSDAPLSPEKWMSLAGVGMTKKIALGDESSIYQYDDDLIKEWKDKGFRAGRIHLDFSALADWEKDPTGLTPKESQMEELKKLCQRFVDNNIPVVIAIRSHDDIINDMPNHREETFYYIIEWWRQIAEYLKDMSHLVAFENFVEYHGFQDIEIESKFSQYVENNESRYPDYVNYRGRSFDNYVREMGYNNLMAEISKVVRVTNPDRIFLFKPDGIGRGGMADIAPWRWGTEGDPLQINNQDTPYWLISVGGSANLKKEYIQALRENNETKKEELLAEASISSWGPAVNFYNGTKLPTWISLFGIKYDPEDEVYNGVPPTQEEIEQYLQWYLTSTQTLATKTYGKRVRIPTGFQQSWWLWDFANHTWNEDNLGYVNTLSTYAFGKGVKNHAFPPKFIEENLTREDAALNKDYRATLLGSCAYDAGDKVTFEKVSGKEWLIVEPDGKLRGVPTEVATDTFTIRAVNETGSDTVTLTINVVGEVEVKVTPSDDSYVQKNRADSNYGTSSTMTLKNSESAFAREGLLQFDLSDIGDINSATLQLTSKNFEGNITLWSIDSSWDESTVTWNTLPATTQEIATFSISSEETTQVDMSNFVVPHEANSFLITTNSDDIGSLYTKESDYTPELILKVEK